ncbi:pitrilysin family protein [uncultured Algimonas sp.]|uniref:M16 family metallopeptidase n=1 Tax=uncultured Algimonas sp. TaxID=1547920 RepID=UPI0026177000|nr:pitrilysin family protein [uncultured Algimonas sp.]
MKYRALLFASVLVLAACDPGAPETVDPSVAAPAEVAASDALPEIEFEKFTLDNGLDVILHVDESDPIVAINLAAHVGSAREVPGKTGFAHLFEHLLFLDSENLGYGGLDEMNTRIGGEGTNGFTTNDMTQYFQAVPADALEKVIWAEADKIGWFINTVNQNVIDREKQVVKNEKRQRVDNQPYGHNLYVIGKAIYPEGHPYNHQVIGSLDDVESATLQDTKDFFAKWYTPQNVTVTITGDFDPLEARRLVTRYFGDIPMGEVQPEREVEPVTLEETLTFVHEDNFATVPQLTLVWPAVAEYHPDSYALEVLINYLTDGKRAPFNEVLIDEQELTTSVGGFTWFKELAGEIYLIVQPKAGEDTDALMPAIEAAFARFQENGIPEDALERIKTEAEVGVYDEVQSALGKAIALAEYNLFRDDPGYLDDDIAALRAVTAEDVMDVYNRYIKDRPYVATSFVPKGELELGLEGAETAKVVEEVVVQGAEADVPYDPDARIFEPTLSSFDRTVEPDFGEPYDLPVPTIWKADAPNGLEIVGLQSDEVPLIEFSIDFDAGKNRASADKPGVAAMMGDLLMKGAGEMDTAAFEDALGNLGSEINVLTGDRFTTIRGKTLARNLDETVKLVEAMINMPAFAEDEFETLRESFAQSAVGQQANPNFLAQQAQARLTYPTESALSVAGAGSEDQIRAITLDDLKAFHGNYMDLSTATLNIVGDYEESEVLATFGTLSDPVEGDLEPKPRPAMADVDETVIYFRDFPDAKQSVIRLSRPALASTDADYPRLDAINFPLGGIYTSKLMTELRVNKGYTYGIGSGASGDKDQGSFAIGTSVRTNSTKESLELIRDIVAEHGRDMTEEELASMKESLMRGQALKTETLGDKLGLVQDISRNDLPADIRAQEMARVQSMTLDDVRALSDAHLRPDAMRIIVVGDAASQKARLEDLGYEVVELN